MKKKMLLKLYVSGMSPVAKTAIANLEEVAKKIEKSYKVTIKVIDIQKHPELAEKNKIIATPTLIKQLPEPMRQIIGDLSEREQLLLGLDIT